MRKLSLRFKTKEGLDRARAVVEERKTDFPTTTFDESRLSMIIEKGEITDPSALGIGVLIVRDSDHQELQIDTKHLRSLNNTSVFAFEPAWGTGPDT